MSIAPDVLKKIRHVEIHTRRLLRGTLSGDSRSALKGSGFEFDQLREYVVGDDIRFVDWKSSARMNKTLVKEYIEDRNRTIMLAVDVSGSSFFGSSSMSKYDVMAQVASVFALVAERGNDNVGLVLFSDKVELFVPPNKGRAHTMLVMERIFSRKYEPVGTDLNAPLRHFANARLKDAVILFISDFVGGCNEKLLKTVAGAYETIFVRYLDKNEHNIPRCGFIDVEDIETGEILTIKATYKGAKSIEKTLKSRLDLQNKLMRKCGIDTLDLLSRQTFVGDVIRFFRRRMSY